MKDFRVGVLRGGPSSEYDVSMLTGAGVLASLRNQGYSPLDIVVTKNGEWLVEGMERYPERLIPTINVFFIAMHGEYGEDGTIQRLLDRFGAKYTGSGAFASHRAMHKAITKDILKNHNIPMAPHVMVGQTAKGATHTVSKQVSGLFGPEYVIKPVNAGSSVGTMMVSNPNLLPKALDDALKMHKEVLVEKRIRGGEATVGVLENFRGESRYVLPTIEIIPPKQRDFFDKESKYDGSTEEICPGRFSSTAKTQLADIAKRVHDILELKQYSRSDFMVVGEDVYFLEVNTLPGLTAESLFPKAVCAVGSSYDELIIHLLRDALR